MSKQAEAILSGQEKGSVELLSIMYGSLVSQIVNDLENVEAANADLHRLGCDAGARLIEDFISRASPSCHSFKETCEVIAKVAFRVYLGVAGEVTPGPSENIFFITLSSNPLIDFVELPPTLTGLKYNAFICGVIQSALEQVQMKVTCEVTRDALVDSNVTEFKLELLEMLHDTFIDLDDN